MDILLKSVFGRTASDVEYYARSGFPYALCISHPDALDVAVQTAKSRHQIYRADMFYSPPYPEFECPGYIVLKDEAAAEDILREVIRTGYECSIAKHGVPVPFLS